MRDTLELAMPVEDDGGCVTCTDFSICKESDLVVSKDLSGDAPPLKALLIVTGTEPGTMTMTCTIHPINICLAIRIPKKVPGLSHRGLDLHTVNDGQNGIYVTRNEF